MCEVIRNTSSESALEKMMACEKIAIEYCHRFSLCVLDVVRKFQKYSLFENGVEKYLIVDYLKQQPFFDGDLSSRVSIALRELENCGYLMYVRNGYKTIGPFAKICMSKTPKQKRLTWRKLELKLSQSSSDLSIPVFQKRRRLAPSTQ